VCNILSLGQIISSKQASASSTAKLINIERQLVYRTDFLHILSSYIELDYLGVYQYMNKKDFMLKVSSDIDILQLFCEIISKRLFIMDDMEFTGQR
jgi:hypothetical protein